MSCPHRKYGTYGTYAQISSYWCIFWLGRNWYLRLFGWLKECDCCKAKFIRWPSWEPAL